MGVLSLNCIVTTDYLWMMSEETDLQGTKGYHLTVLSAAISFIKSLEVDDEGPAHVSTPSTPPASLPVTAASVSGDSEPQPEARSLDSLLSSPLSSKQAKRGRARATHSTIGGVEAPSLGQILAGSVPHAAVVADHDLETRAVAEDGSCD